MSEKVDMAALIRDARKSPEDVASLMGSRREEVTLPIMKPLRKGVYWHARPGEEWHYTQHSMLFLPSDRNAGRDSFMLIAKHLEGFVASKLQIKSVARVFGLVLVVDTFGTPGFWALNLQDSSSWGTSAREIADKLTQGWGMVIAEAGRYVMMSPLGELDPPKWPEGSPDDLLKIAFKDRVITTEDHPEFLKLLGKS